MTTDNVNERASWVGRTVRSRRKLHRLDGLMFREGSIFTVIGNDLNGLTLKFHGKGACCPGCGRKKTEVQGTNEISGVQVEDLELRYP